MKKNDCDLELRLRPSFEDSDLSVSSDDGSSVHQHVETEVLSKRPKQQQMTFFYNGKVSTCEVTELQARAIIMLASGDSGVHQRARACTLESPKVVCNKSPIELSMKRSLQRFFQKRHQRIQGSSPYSHRESCVYH